ncbi:hypothetical protein FH972_022112 [Carpinus fangiana]|uniref:Uncharacterized protein n=1 Tax=Carpinus fangiana TaxID=176857 RepID=A0A5N6KRN1_9ROSI|nr:hypothetical protein FH972_022112 [Carpinus fangiana]
MEIDAANCAFLLVKTDVVESLETGARDGADAVVRYQEVLLPAHENVLAVGKVLVVELGLPGFPRQRLPGWKAIPVLHVDLVIGAPVGSARLEGVFVADDFALEIGREIGVVLREICLLISRCSFLNFRRRRTLNGEVATHDGLAHVHVLDFHRDIVLHAV